MEPVKRFRMYSGKNGMIDWFGRFAAQLEWTKPVREYIYRKFGFDLAGNDKALLDMGCGTGNLLLELGRRFTMRLYGIDLDGGCLKKARNMLDRFGIKAELYAVDAASTPFPPSYFDYVMTHLFFMWTDKPAAVFREILRILKPGGLLFILCEPDYGGLIEYPDTGFGKVMIENLLDLGADPYIGRRLPAIFSNITLEIDDKGVRNTSAYDLIEKLMISVPWLACEPPSRRGLISEVRFYSNLLGNRFNPRKVLEAINSGKYFFYNPFFGFILRKKNIDTSR